MKLWDSLRTAFQLAARVEEVESHVRDLEFEWGDIQDKLLAREERLRKRMSRELKSSLSESPSPTPLEPQLTPPGDSKAERLSIIRRWQESSAQRRVQ